MSVALRLPNIEQFSEDLPILSKVARLALVQYGRPVRFHDRIHLSCERDIDGWPLAMCGRKRTRGSTGSFGPRGTVAIGRSTCPGCVKAAQKLIDNAPYWDELKTFRYRKFTADHLTKSFAYMEERIR